MPGKTGAGLEVVQAPGAPVVPEGIFVSGGLAQSCIHGRARGKACVQF